VAYITAATRTTHHSPVRGAALNIITVCTGNICRSPLASQIIAANVSSFGVRVTSAGTRARDGAKMPIEALRIADARGVDPSISSMHSARFLTADHLSGVDLAIGLAREHRREIVELSPSMMRRTFTLRELSRLADAVSDNELLQLAAGDGTDPTPQGRMSAFLGELGALRGLRGVIQNPAEDDVVDPFGRSARTYAQTARELDESIPAIVRLIRLAFSPSS